MVARGWRVEVGEMHERGHKVQTSSYKVSHVMYSMRTVVNNTVLQI